MTRYALTGPTGQLGSRILKKVLDKKLIPLDDLIVSSSNPAHVPEIAARFGVESRHGDYTSRASLQSAFEGADVLLLISHPDPGIERVKFHIDAIEAARSVGVDTVVYTSMMFGGETGSDSVISVQQGHVHTMKYLAECGMKHVIVREGLYAQYWGYFAGTQFWMFEDAPPYEWVIPNDGPIAYTDMEDLAEGTALVVVDHEKFVGQTLRFTGPRTHTVQQIADSFERQTGQKITLRLVGEEEAVRYHLARVQNPQHRSWLENHWGPVYRGLARNEGAVVDPVLGTVLGRPVRGIEDMAEQLFVLR